MTDRPFILYFKGILEKSRKLPPPLWLLALITSLSIFSEAMYTPALPQMAMSLKISVSQAEQTLSIYFLGMAMGTLFWGWFSDSFGRRLTLLMGLIVYTLGCLGCLKAPDIQILLYTRFLQALGGSVGTVLGQAMTHDVYRGKERGQIFSSIGMLLSVASAMGPVIGGFLVQACNWRIIFGVLTLWSALLMILGFFKAPETQRAENRKKPPLFSVLRAMCQDPKVLACGLIVGTLYGLLFSFNAEGPFYLIKMCGLRPLEYGLCFTSFAFMSGLGNFVSKHLHNTLETSEILKRGVIILVCGSTFFALGTFGLLAFDAPKYLHIILTLTSMCLLFFGRGLCVANCLSLSLENYVKVAGSATSLFVCFYYGLISFFTLVMAVLHNGTLLPMPFYFMGLTLLMLCISFLTPPSEKDPPLFTPSE